MRLPSARVPLTSENDDDDGGADGDKGKTVFSINDITCRHLFALKTICPYASVTWKYGFPRKITGMHVSPVIQNKLPVLLFILKKAVMTQTKAQALRVL